MTLNATIEVDLADLRIQICQIYKLAYASDEFIEEICSTFLSQLMVKPPTKAAANRAAPWQHTYVNKIANFDELQLQLTTADYAKKKDLKKKLAA